MKISEVESLDDRFDRWMDQVDYIISEKYSGNRSDDFPDWDWKQCWRCGDTPEIAVESWEEDDLYGPYSY